MKLLFTFTERENIEKEALEIASRLAKITKTTVAYTLNFKNPHTHILCDFEFEKYGEEIFQNFLSIKGTEYVIVGDDEQRNLEIYMEKESLVLRISPKEKLIEFQNRRNELEKTRKELAGQLVCVEQEIKKLDEQILKEHIKKQLSSTKGDDIHEFKEYDK